MVMQPDRDGRRADVEGFDMRALWRLVLWGATATAAMVVVVVAQKSEIGSQRLAFALNTALTLPQRFAEAPPAPTIAASAETDAETRRLITQVRSLSADRDRLLVRLTALERNFDNVTGSIGRSAARASDVIPVAPPAPAKIAATPSPPPSVPAATSAPVPTAPAMVTAMAPPAGAAESGIPLPIPRPADGAAGASVAPRTEFGIDLGAATSVEGLRALWMSLRGTQPALLEGLRPVVLVREDPRSHTSEYRLIGGPLPNGAAAARLCTAFATAGRACQPSLFDGQKLALR